MAVQKLAEQKTSTWGLVPASKHKTERFRKMEIDHAFRHAMRSRRIALELLAEAERDNLIPAEKAIALRKNLDNP